MASAIHYAQSLFTFCLAAPQTVPFLLVLLTLALHRIAPPDPLCKKIALAAGIVASGLLAATSSRLVARTCQFLFSVMVIQLITIGFLFLLTQNSGALRKLVAGWMVLVNCLGVFLAFRGRYYEQLFSDRAMEMLRVVVMGFVSVWVLDQALERWLKVSAESRRKIFHVAPLLTLPVLSKMDFTLFTLMLTGSFYLFLEFELIRYLLLPGLGKPVLVRWMEGLNSSREKNLWYTHLYLILGLGMPYYYYAGRLQHVSLVLVLGDAMAAFVGRSWGRHKIWGAKTAEGLMAFMVTVAGGMFWGLLIPDWGMILAISAVCGMVELLSGDLDNIALPLSCMLAWRAMQGSEGY